MLNKRLKITLPVLLALLCIVCLCITSILSDFSEKTSNDVNLNETDSVSSEYKIIQEKSGLYGIKDSSGSQIISSQWNSINIVNEECFIVSKKLNGSEFFGIIDSKENILSALAYENLYQIAPNIIIGKPHESNSSLIMRTDGSMYTDTYWDSFTIDSDKKNIELSKNRNKYYAKIQDNELVFHSFRFLRSCKNISFSLSSDFSQHKGNVSFKTAEQMADVATAYIEAVSLNDSIAIRNTTSAEYYSNIIPPEYMGMNINAINDAIIKISNNNAYNVYEVSMKIDYTKTHNTETSQYVQTSEITEKTGTADFKITMEKNSDGFIIVKSVYYIG